MYLPIPKYSQSNSFFFSFLFYSFLFQKIIIFLENLYFIEHFNISENNIILLSNRPGLAQVFTPVLPFFFYKAHYELVSGIIIIPRPAACTCKTMQWSEYLWLLIVKWWRRRRRWCSDIQSGGGFKVHYADYNLFIYFCKKIILGDKFILNLFYFILFYFIYLFIFWGG
jgi:hypothetical protein